MLIGACLTTVPRAPHRLHRLPCRVARDALAEHEPREGAHALPPLRQWYVPNCSDASLPARVPWRARQPPPLNCLALMYTPFGTARMCRPVACRKGWDTFAVPRHRLPLLLTMFSYVRPRRARGVSRGVSCTGTLANMTTAKHIT